MKKLFLSLVLFLSCTLMASAQFYVGGTLGISHSSLDAGGSEDISGTSFKILPEVGYQFNEHWSFGGSIGYVKGFAALGAFDPTDVKALGNAMLSTALDLASDENLADMDLSSFRIAPYARYTFVKAGNFEFFLEGGIAYSYIKVKSTADVDGTPVNVDDNLSAFEINIRPGIAFNCSDKFSLVAKIGSLGYQRAKVDDMDITLSRFGLDVDGNNIMFGAFYKF